MSDGNIVLMTGERTSGRRDQCGLLCLDRRLKTEDRVRRC